MVTPLVKTYHIYEDGPVNHRGWGDSTITLEVGALCCKGEKYNMISTVSFTFTDAGRELYHNGTEVSIFDDSGHNPEKTWKAVKKNWKNNAGKLVK